MSSRRFPHQYPTHIRQQDSPLLSEASSGRASSMSNLSRRNGNNPEKHGSFNDVNLGSSSSPSITYKSDTENSTDEVSEYENDDPAVNKALLHYMIDTRKRHLRFKKELISKSLKAWKLRHQNNGEIPGKKAKYIDSRIKESKEVAATRFVGSREQNNARREINTQKSANFINISAPVKLERSPKVIQHSTYHEPYQNGVRGLPGQSK